jgi:hypothetical protein
MGVIDSGGLASALDPDTANNCPVDLTSSLAMLGSGQQGDADNYRTMCYIGGAHPEFISYQTATLVSANKYNLSYLRRGLGGTNPGAHLLNDPFLRMDESVWVWPYDPAVIGKAGILQVHQLQHARQHGAIAGIGDRLRLHRQRHGERSAVRKRSTS